VALFYAGAVQEYLVGLEQSFAVPAQAPGQRAA